MKVHITGAGFSGLTLGYLLVKRGFEVEIFEKSDRVGGLLQTQKAAGLFAEGAANGLLLTDEIQSMLNDLDLPFLESQKASRRRYIYRAGLRRWPLNLWETAGLIWRFLKTRLLGLHRPRPFETVEAWGERVVGRAATKHLLAPALQGIYAGDIARMSASLVLGRMFQRPRRRMGPLISPHGGMDALTEALARFIRAHGGRIHLATDRTPDPSHDVLALSARGFRDQYYPELELLSLVKITVKWKAPTRKIDGFGVLFPRSEGVRALGALSSEHIFGREQEQNTEAWIFGGALDPDAIRLSDEDLLKQIREDRARALGGFDEMESYSIFRWPESLPHYTLELEKFLATFEKENSTRFTGNFLGDLGLSRIFERNLRIANQWSRSHG